MEEFKLTKSIEDVSQLDKEEAIKLKEQGVIEVLVYFKGKHRGLLYDAYDIDEYIAILDKLKQITKGVTKDMPEEKRFAIIYERICKGIEYDGVAANPKTPEEEEYSKRVKDTSRNLRNGLLEGKCVCVGFSEILRNALALCGIDSEYVGNRNHAWNKVKLNGEWFNVDATNDRYYFLNGIRPKRALKSDEDYVKMGYEKGFGGPQCLRSATQQEINEIFPIKPYEYIRGVAKEIIEGYKEIGKIGIKASKEFRKQAKIAGKAFIEDVKTSGIRTALVNKATSMIKTYIRILKVATKSASNLIKKDNEKEK